MLLVVMLTVSGSKEEKDGGTGRGEGLAVKLEMDE